MTSQQFLVCDNSTAANFKSWASALSNFIRSAGWTNSSDTGQLNGAGAGNWPGVSTVPGSGAFYYEIFQPGDGFQNFYLKIEYGNSSGSANSPTMRTSIGTGTNGAGTLTGFVIGPWVAAFSSFTAPSTTTQYECDFSGDSGRLSILMWRNAPNNAPQVFAVQRSLNSSGSAYGTSTTGYVTMWSVGNNSGFSNINGSQQSLVFGIGTAQNFLSGGNANTTNCMGWPSMNLSNAVAGSLAFNQTIALSFQQPVVGFFDYPCTVVGYASNSDFSEGVPLTIVNQYGQTRTYIPTHVTVLGRFNNVNGNDQKCLLVEYD